MGNRHGAYNPVIEAEGSSAISTTLPTATASRRSTIGAAYMAAGLPVPEADHVDRAVQMGLDMVAAIVPLRQEIGVS